MKIKAITLWQPWASLMAFGDKRIETRSWPTAYCGLLAIHAAKKIVFPADPLFQNALFELGYNTDGLPTGCILGVCRLLTCAPITPAWDKWHRVVYPDGSGLPKFEYFFGDYTPGRYAWITEDMHRFEEPIPCKGRQGLWDWEVQEGIELPEDK